ncbi:MAG: HAMP domain-containing histidine kinase, partial [Bdellovibrionales bacterium]|nr:HAMP domain-containing histidine kinase [Bdellovibrionales bacterium]
SQLRTSGHLFRIVTSNNQKIWLNAISEAVDWIESNRKQRESLELYDKELDLIRQTVSAAKLNSNSHSNRVAESKKRLEEINKRLAVLFNIVVQLQNVDSISQIESVLLKELEPFGIQSVKLNLGSANFTKKSKAKINIEIGSQGSGYGHVSFSIIPETKSVAGLKSFLVMTTNLVNVVVERILSHQETEEAKRDWEMTFASIEFPILIVDQNYQVERSNVQSGGRAQKKCFELLFNRTEPCEGCQLGGQFRLTEGGRYFDVSSQTQGASDKRFVNVYKDVTHEVTLQKKVVERAKTAEMGVIGSSIAHEINNPLAGILALIQINKSDVDQNSEIFEDLMEMEKATLRCRDIVQNLLHFSRTGSGSRVGSVTSAREFNAVRALKVAIQIAELRTRSRGFKIDVYTPDHPVNLVGDPDLFSQALLLLFDMGLQDNKESSISAGSPIRVTLSEVAESLLVQIQFVEPIDLKSQTSLVSQQLSQVRQNIERFGGTLELSPGAGVGELDKNTVRIILPKK